jgi:hypothetical protein
MKRRQFLEIATAAGVAAVVLPAVAAPAAGAAVLVVDRPMAAIPGFRTIRIGPGGFFSMESLAGVAIGSRIVGIVGAANAVLLMEALRELRASVSHAGHAGAAADGGVIIVARIRGAD